MALISSVFVTTSLDGFIARTNGALYWLDNANAKITKDANCNYHDFMKNIDVLVKGKDKNRIIQQ